MESYTANYTLLIEKVKENCGPAVLGPLWKQTFVGRRHEIVTGLLTDPSTIIRERCPILNRQFYVSLIVFSPNLHFIYIQI